MYGFKALDVSEGELVSTVWHDEHTVQRFEDFSLSVTELCRQTFDELLNFYRVILTQQDANGRTPVHYAATGKFTRSNKAAIALLDIGLEKEEGFHDFEHMCSQIAFLDDSPDTNIDPKRRYHIMKEIRHLIIPAVYKNIMKEFNQRRKELLKEVLNKGDKDDHTPLHAAAYFGNYAMVRHFLKLGADPD